MARTQPPSGHAIDRRTFLVAGLAVATGAVVEPAGLETFTQWLRASQRTRARGLQPCAERIRSLDASIQAWVQVLPQQPTRSGNFRNPVRGRDIIETKGLATELPVVYKGRTGTADAAIVRESPTRREC
jgi:hypothetical protein